MKSPSYFLHLHLVQKLRNNGAIAPLPHMPHGMKKGEDSFHFTKPKNN